MTLNELKTRLDTVIADNDRLFPTERRNDVPLMIRLDHYGRPRKGTGSRKLKTAFLPVAYLSSALYSSSQQNTPDRFSVIDAVPQYEPEA